MWFGLFGVIGRELKEEQRGKNERYVDEAIGNGHCFAVDRVDNEQRIVYDLAPLFLLESCALGGYHITLNSRPGYAELH
jgi:hypothetical protein